MGDFDRSDGVPEWDPYDDPAPEYRPDPSSGYAMPDMPGEAGDPDNGGEPDDGPDDGPAAHGKLPMAVAAVAVAALVGGAFVMTYRPGPAPEETTKPVHSEPARHRQEARNAEDEPSMPNAEDLVTGEAKEQLEAQESAADSARLMLEQGPISHDALVEALEQQGYDSYDAVVAADDCGADWDQQAADAARSAMSEQALSKGALRDELVRHKFTDSQIDAATSSLDFRQLASRRSQELLLDRPLSKSTLRQALVSEGFSESEADYATGHGIDWEEQAAQDAYNYRSQGVEDVMQLRDLLTGDGFSKQEIDAALAGR